MVMEEDYEFLIIDTLKNEIVIDPGIINNSEEAFLTLLYLNTGLEEDGLFPNFQMISRRKSLLKTIGGIV